MREPDIYLSLMRFQSCRGTRDAEVMAQTLREAMLKAEHVSITESESLEVIAKILGFHDWNVLSARIRAEHGHPADPLLATPLPGAEGASLPTVPLREMVLFPRRIQPFYVGRDTTKRAIEHAMADDKRVLALAQRCADDDNPTPDDLYGVGVTANILHLKTLADGDLRLIVEGRERVNVLRLAEGPFLTAEVAPAEESRGREAEALSLMPAVLEKLAALLNVNLSSPPYAEMAYLREPAVLADAIPPLLHIVIDWKQDLLETGDIVTRLEKILDALTRVIASRRPRMTK